jgi:hypothetical protein
VLSYLPERPQIYCQNAFSRIKVLTIPNILISLFNKAKIMRFVRQFPLFFFPLLFLVLNAATCRQQMANDEVRVRYSSAFEDIEIAADILTYTKTTYEYDNPVSATPSGSSSTSFHKALSRSEVRKLSSFIMESGFMELGPAYGAPEEQRYYPYEIHVKLGEITKVVMFRSNPSYEEAPEAFRKVDEYLHQLSD